MNIFFVHKAELYYMKEVGLTGEYFDDVPHLLHVSLIICSTKSHRHKHHVYGLSGRTHVYMIENGMSKYILK